MTATPPKQRTVMLRYFCAITLTVLCLPVRADSDSSAPAGANCNLSAPPTESGEDAVANTVFLVYPRASALSASYSGCQATWFAKTDGTTIPSEWSVLAVALLERGKLVRIWSPLQGMEQKNACRFSNGATVAGDPKACRHPSSEEFPTRSFPAGCLKKMQAAGGRMPDECMRYE